MTAVEFSEGAMGTTTPQLCNKTAESSILRRNTLRMEKALLNPFQCLCNNSTFDWKNKQDSDQAEQ